MKSKSLRVTIPDTRRDFYLYRPRPGDDFHIRFTPPAWMRERLGLTQKRIERSTGLKLVDPAIAQAKVILRSFWAAAQNGAPQAPMTMRSETFAPVGAVLERYAPPVRKVSLTTREQNKNSFRRFLREATGQGNVERLSMGLFRDAELVKKYQQARIGHFEDEECEGYLRAAYSADRVLAQVRSVLKPAYMGLYAGLALPDLTAFRAAPSLSPRRDFSFVPFPPGTVAAIDALLPKMPVGERRACLLMRRMGLRNSEVESARRKWFERRDDGSVTLRIGQPHYKTKNGMTRVIAVPPSVLEAMGELWVDREEFIVPASSDHERREICNRRLNAWLRPLLPDRQKCAYELRKYAGSVVWTRAEAEGGGRAATAYFLGDTVEVVESYYAKYLRPVSGVGDDELRGYRVVVAAA